MNLTGMTLDLLKSEVARMQREAMNLRRSIMRMPRDADLSEIHAQIAALDDQSGPMAREVVRRERLAAGDEPANAYERAMYASCAKDG